MKKFSLIILVSAAFLTSCDSADEPDSPEGPDNTGPHRVTFKAVEYRPAPGQFVNEIPLYENGDNETTMNAKALEALNRGSLISLGALGGEIVLTLSEPIFYSAAHDADFRVLGNSYITGNSDGVYYGSAEPGMVWVMKDENGNGKPDDKWYVFLGKMKDQVAELTITYRPVPEPVASRWVDWSADDGTSGSLTCNLNYHNHTYFPKWKFSDETKAEMTLTALCLPPNGFLETSSGLFRQICYEGFADCFPNNDDRSAFSLKDAVDLNGKPANLDRIDFIKVITAVIDSNGPLGETSTEVGGIEVLH